MSKRIIYRNQHAKVIRDSEWQEYIVKFYDNGVYLKEADYFTSDKQDALSNAELWNNKQLGTVDK